MNDEVEREPVQGPRYTEGLDNSSTELARVIAAHFGWEVDLDDAVWAGRRQLAGSIVELAKGVDAAGWLVHSGNRLVGVAWSAIPHTNDAAAERLLAG